VENASVSNEPALDLPPAEHPAAVALVLHGGKASSYGRVESGQLAVRRMEPFAREIARRDPAIAVVRLRYRYRGWNEPHAHPVADVEYALDRIGATYGRAPVVLVGHSMGGRAAARAAGHPSVRGVVALAPWLPDGEPVGPIAGRDLVVIHGTRDVTTSPRASARFAARAAGVAREVMCLRVPRSGHAMLLRAGLWHRLASEFVGAIASSARLAPIGVSASASGCRECGTGDH
jgi:dienelactone hydrolase